MSIDKIWIFQIQDGFCGGIIVADSEEEAREKLSSQRGMKMPKSFTNIFPLSSLDLNNSVHDLW